MLQKWKNRQKKQGASVLRRAGFTLVETMISVLLLTIMMAMVVGIVSPAFRVFVRMQKVQFAQMILDGLVEDVQDAVREATGYVKIYANDSADATGVAGAKGADSGQTLEYLNTDGYVVLVSTGGCATTYLYHNFVVDSTFDKVDNGRLLYRYYSRENMSTTSPEAYTYYYNTQNSGTNYPVARAATTAFGSGYYMGNYLKIVFSYPMNDDGTVITASDGTITHLEATASLYNDKKMEDDDLVATKNFFIDLRYQVKPYYVATATTDKTDETKQETVINWSGGVTPTTE